jgi:hypothetical protein
MTEMKQVETFVATLTDLEKEMMRNMLLSFDDFGGDFALGDEIQGVEDRSKRGALGTLTKKGRMADMFYADCTSTMGLDFKTAQFCFGGTPLEAVYFNQRDELDALLK